MGATKSSTTRCMLDMKTCLAYDWIRLFDDRYTLLLVWSIWWNSPLYHFSQYSCVKVVFSYPYDVICLIFHVILVTYSVILGGSNVLIFVEFITSLASE